jgi:EAL domain-containing protein (putative c-di-GMP-specific phosphodiesterase class I)/CHASE2 domain-containing sensor protein/GGDEF domain-containing protein
MTFRGLWKHPWVRNTIGTLLVLGAINAAMALGWLRPADDLFDAMRFRAVPSEASNGLAIVEIDARSLEKAGSWPWERERYAAAIERLVAAGATLVALDIDFSASSDTASDGALAETISRYPGQVALGAFIQHESFAAGHRELVENRPITALTQDALIASVNVPVDHDGEVRRYAYGSSSHASIAATLAGLSKQGEFAIDYGIDHRSIPHLSFDDILQNRFDPALVKGRVVLVGATALELGDEFATPVGLLPGIVVHGLAYESIINGRALLTLNPWALLALCLMLSLLLLPRRGGRSLRVLLIRHALVAAAIIGLPIIVQAFTPISIRIAPLLLTQMLFAIWATRTELVRRGRAIIREREAGLLHLALHHVETELPNRRALLRQIETAQDPDQSECVVTVGVERHAEMRGVVGYNVANALIGMLARRVAEITGADCVAHISSSVLGFSKPNLSHDELTILLNSLEAIETNFTVEGHSIDIYLRIGAARAEAGTMSPEVLIERATLALGKAQTTVSRVAIYDEAAFGSPSNNLALMTEMLDALKTGDVTLHYQPKMQTSDGVVTSVEALCRWRHPERGPIYPDLFIPIAEETGQIRALTEWCFLQAIKDQAILRAAGHDLTIALNISGRLLADESFKDKVLEFANSVETKLCLEITETAVIDNPERATEATAAFRAAGLKISIDDYGSGLSSLSYLKLLNADELKVDKSLVVGVAESQRDRLIMKSTIDLAHGLGMSVVAEGVEDSSLAACLSLLGCDVLQGYWLSKPLTMRDLLEFMATRAAGAAEHDGEDVSSEVVQSRRPRPPLRAVQ